jgi:hypothetical protein
MEHNFAIIPQAQPATNRAMPKTRMIMPMSTAPNSEGKRLNTIIHIPIMRKATITSSFQNS